MKEHIPTTVAPPWWNLSTPESWEKRRKTWLWNKKEIESFFKSLRQWSHSINCYRLTLKLWNSLPTLVYSIWFVNWLYIDVMNIIIIPHCITPEYMNWKLLNENFSFDDVLTCFSPITGKTPKRTCEINKTSKWAQKGGEEVIINSICSSEKRKKKRESNRVQFKFQVLLKKKIQTHIFLSGYRNHWTQGSLMSCHDMASTHRQWFLHHQGEFSFEIGSICSMTTLNLSLKQQQHKNH